MIELIASTRSGFNPIGVIAFLAFPLFAITYLRTRKKGKLTAKKQQWYSRYFLLVLGVLLALFALYLLFNSNNSSY